MANVNVSLSATDAGLVAKWQAAKASVAAFQQQVQSAGRAGKAAGQQTGGAFAQAKAQIGGVATQLLGFSTAAGAAVTAVQLIRQQVDALAESQNRAARTQITAAAAERELRFVTGKEGDEIVKQVTRSTFGVDLAEALSETTAAMSARGDVSRADALETARMAREVQPLMSSQDRQALVQAALEIQKAFQGFDPRTAMARALDIVEPARTTAIGPLAQNVVPAIAQISAFGKGKEENFSELASIIIAIGQRSGDPEGRRTASASVRFVQQIQEALANAGLLNGRESVSDMIDILQSERGTRVKAELLGSAASRLGVRPDDVINAPSKLTGESRQLIGMFELLDANSRTSELRAEAQSLQAKSNQQALDKMTTILGDIARSSSQTAANIMLQGKEEETRRQVKNVEGASIGQQTENFQRLLKDEGIPDFFGVRGLGFRYGSRVLRKIPGADPDAINERLTRILAPESEGAIGASFHGTGSISQLLIELATTSESAARKMEAASEKMKQAADQQLGAANQQQQRMPDPVTRPATMKQLSD